uniref:Outer membrane protein p44 n=12 Tax=Anaplasma TaxID=768 RepID=F8QPK0_9RICK|nr:outer membrane protein p44 [Anaplasma platys]
MKERKLALSGAVAMTVLVSTAGTGTAAGSDVDYVSKFGEGSFYVGLNYSPAFSKINGFEIRESTGETAAVYPYMKDGTRVEWKAEKFDWNTPDPRIKFKNNPIVALEGSVGYSIGVARVELEIGYEQFKTKGIRDTGSKEEEADAVYLLAKKLPHTLVSDQSDKFLEELKNTKAAEIVKFAEAVGTSAKDIDGKVCKKGGSGNAAGSWKCTQTGSNGVSTAEFSKIFTKADVNTDNKGKAWPNGNNDAAKAEDLSIALNRELTSAEKNKVAGLLTRTISGGEVVEIRAVSTTSVMLNGCYDLQSEGFSIVPYACLGVGANFVGIVDGHVTPKLAYKVKAGLSYELSPEISMFAGGFYHRVLGEGEYDDLPVQRLVDDATTNKTKEFAKASFKMAYTGAEIGVRSAF